MAVTPSPVMMVQPRTFLENDSLTSIEKSPTLSYRPSTHVAEAPYSCSVPVDAASYMSQRQQPSWLNPQVRRATTSNLPAMSAAAGWNFNPLQHYPIDTEDALMTEYSNQLVAPIATPETLSEESAGGSISSLAKRAHKFLRRDKTSSKTAINKDAGSSSRPLPAPHQSCSSSDVYEMTESSSVYCASPLSSARAASSVQTRTSQGQLKREIMRLYQRAAADVEKMERSPNDQQTGSSSASHSRSTSSSSSSQPSRLFPMLDPTSPVFGCRNGSHSNSSNQSRFASSPVTSRPATANGATGQGLSPSSKPVLPPCNTSF